MTQEQVTAKIMRMGSDLGIRGHVTTEQIIARMIHMGHTHGVDLELCRSLEWSFGDELHCNILRIIDDCIKETIKPTN